MSELAGRMALEGDVSRRLSRLSSRHRRELLALLGDPPDASRVTAEFWSRVERERQAELLVLLLSVYMASQMQHSEELLPGPVAGAVAGPLSQAGRVWSETRAAEVARGAVEGMRAALAQRAATWAELGDAVTRQMVADDVADVISPTQDAVTAATETTAAQTAGTNAVVQAAQVSGFNLVTRWKTERDDRVCPVCRPLDNKIPDLWGPVLETLVAPGGGRAVDAITANGGPPAHPNCRCYLVTAPEKTATRVRR